MAKTFALAVMPIVVLGALAGATVLIAKDPFGSDGSHVEAVKTLAVAHPQQELPGPRARKLRLLAFGGETCDEELFDIKKRESKTAVSVSASFRLDLGGCDELSTAMETFEVTLKRPLGQRVVVDASGDSRRVIWSPVLRQRNRATAELTEGDALRFATSLFPQAAGSKCVPAGPYFECRYIRRGQRYRLILRKELGGRFSVFDRPKPDPTCPLKGGVQRGCP